MIFLFEYDRPARRTVLYRTFADTEVDKAFDEHLKKYLFTTLPITERESSAETQQAEEQSEKAKGASRRWNG